MARALYKFVDGEFKEIYSTQTTETEAPAVHQDTLKSPLRNPVTGRIHDSTSTYLKECKTLGLEVVGNDLMSKRPDGRVDKINEAMIMDKIEKAESIVSDPTKYREYQNRNLELYERNQRLLEQREKYGR